MYMTHPLSLASVLLLSAVTFGADKAVDFTKDIRPILSQRCFKCHGPDENKREAGLRLDTPEGALQKLDSGVQGIVPGQPEASEIMTRITTPDADLRMPPAGEGEPLSAAQVDLLTRWIREGAKYSVHWSFVPPVRPEMSSLPSSEWCRNAIDRFVSAELEQRGLQPSPEADRYALCRRLYLDLTGLPPTVEQVDAFVANESPDAVEELVDELLASPAFGERWGRIWLDLARYADSAGYADDPPRTIWMYRDWVINAMNDDMPLDQFTIEQLAGDLLQQPTSEQLIATAFHRNTMTNSEGGTDDEEFRTAAIVDRVNTTMQVWMGMTMACAQCHTHKYDPITQEEYFRFYAILNQTEDADRRDESPNLELFTASQEREKHALLDRITSLEEQLKSLEKAPPGAEQSGLPEGELKVRYVRIELPGRERILSLAEVQVFSGETNLAMSGKASQSSTDYDGVASRAIDGNTDGHYFNANSTTHTSISENPWWEVVLPEARKVDRISVWNRTDSEGIGRRLDGFRVILFSEERLPLWASEFSDAAAAETVVNVPATSADFSDAQKSLLASYRRSASPEQEKLRQQIEAEKKKLAAIKPIPTPILRELPEDQLRKTHIQIRGNFLDLGPEVTPGVPGAFSEHIPFSPEVDDRLSLARWLVDRGNPLTARVVANRYWEAIFGMGLVETSEDFGMQGELPSHPELLDSLAVELMESGWDTKFLVRLIVTSATYRQDSSVTPEVQEADPNNKWLSRGPRFRMSAETIRDQALAIGGLLSDKMFGPPVYPPRPRLGLTAAFGRSTDWETSPGEDMHRRGLYTWWQRTMPYPSMDAFDAPSREVCTIRRIRTNTPLQALVTLNDPVYVEAARGLAGRMLSEGGQTDESRLTHGFRLCAARYPGESELAVLENLLSQARSRFESNPASAKDLSAIGQGDLSSVPAAEQAAWSVVANVLLNLDETLARR